MKVFCKISAAMLAVAFIVGLTGPSTAFAATTPSLGLAATYGVLAGTYTNTSAAATVNGDIGFTTGPLVAPLGAHTHYGSGVPYPVAHTTDAATALTSLNTGPCDFNFGSVQDLSLLAQPLAPGVYCIAAATSIGTGGITLSGAGTYIFRITGALTTAANSIVHLNGASPCDLFWAPTAATTLGANTTFAGTIIDNANAITVGANTVWTGRALSLGAGTITTGDTATISVPVCSAPVVPAPISVVPPLISVVKVPNPLALPAGPGSVTYTYTLTNIGTVPVSSITMVDDSCSPLALTSGDTSNDSILGLTEVWTYTCSAPLTTTHTNTVIATGWANGIKATDSANATVIVGSPTVPPIIHVGKVPSPLALPAGGGQVTYTETITNPGTVALSNVRLTDDKCGSVTYASGDSNSDSKLDPTESWVYTCRAYLAQTTQNTAVATGDANGITARDVATATVVVAASVTPVLPSSGLDPQDSGVLAGLLVVGVLTLGLFFVRRRQLGKR